MGASAVTLTYADAYGRAFIDFGPVAYFPSNGSRNPVAQAKPSRRPANREDRGPASLASRPDRAPLSRRRLIGGARLQPLVLGFLQGCRRLGALLRENGGARRVPSK
jgi:hypothetical protein